MRSTARRLVAGCAISYGSPRRPPAAVRGIGGRHRRLWWGHGVLLARDDHEVKVAFESVGYRHLTEASLTSGLLTLE